MKAIAFDTLEFAKKLKTANFAPDQAEALAEALAGMVEEQLATKRDIKELEAAMKEMETSLRRDMREMENSLRRDMREMELRLKHDLTLRLGGMLTAGIAVVAALIKLL